MRDTVFYMRGQIPGQDLAITTDALEDMKGLLDLSEESFRGLCVALQEQDGFLDNPAIRELFQHHLEEGVAKNLFRLFVVFQRRAHQDGETTRELIQRIKKFVDDNPNAGLIARSDIEALELRLVQFLAPYSSLISQSKAEQLCTVLGQELERIELICDIRPIFSDDRTCVEGMMPFTTLKIVTKGVDGLPNATEAVMTEEDVSQLLDAAEKAKKKLQGLRDHFTKQETLIPNTKLTRITSNAN